MILRITFILLVTVGLAYGGGGRPLWVENAGAVYSTERYLTGLGIGDSYEKASERAYASIAKIFSAEVTYGSSDEQTYRSRGNVVTEETKISQSVKVQTKRELENVKISERYFDEKRGEYYALATMDRDETSSVLKGKIKDLNAEAERYLESSDKGISKLEKIRHMYKAVSKLALSDRYYNDLRIIDPAGTRIVENKFALISGKFDDFMKQEVKFGVSAEGEIREWIIGRLAKNGLAVIGEKEAVPDFIINAEVEMTTVISRDPKWKYVRWQAGFKIVNAEKNETVAGVSISGREGHLSELEAKEKSLRILKKKIEGEVMEQLFKDFFNPS